MHNIKNSAVLVQINPAHSTYRIYTSIYTALQNIIGIERTKLYSGLSQLDNLDTIFIIDECYMPHRVQWISQQFRDACNANGVHVVVFNVERVFNSLFSESIPVQNAIESFKNVTQFLVDTDDCHMKKQKTAMKQSMSRFFETYTIPPTTEKQNKIIFRGSIYHNRNDIITKVNSKYPVDIHHGNCGDFQTYLKLIQSYKYVLCPRGAGSFFNPRFYETLFVGSVPLQEYNDSMSPYYDQELKAPGIFFRTVDELIEKLDAQPDIKSEPYNFWLDDVVQSQLEETFTWN